MRFIFSSIYRLDIRINMSTGNNSSTDLRSEFDRLDCVRWSNTNFYWKRFLCLFHF